MAEKNDNYLTSFDKKLVEVTPQNVEAAIEAANRLRAAGEIEGVNIHGFVDVSLGALANLAPMSRISLQECRKVELGPLYDQTGLDSLVITSDPVRVDLSRFGSLRHLCALWHPKSTGLETLRQLTHLSLSKTGERFRDIASLGLSPTLRDLQLTQAKVTSLAGLEKLPVLEELGLTYLRAPIDLSALGQARKLQVLFLSNLPRPLHVEAAGQCRSLQNLNVQDCGEFETLQWMKDLESLEKFTFMDTRVKDCDLSVLAGLPKLRQFGVTYRREFRPPLKELTARLRAEVFA